MRGTHKMLSNDLKKVAVKTLTFVMSTQRDAHKKVQI